MNIININYYYTRELVNESKTAMPSAGFEQYLYLYLQWHHTRIT